MATYLYRLGRWSYDRRRWVVGAWLARGDRGGRSAPRRSAARPTASSRCPAPSPSRRRTCSSRSSPAPAAPSARIVFAAPEGREAHRRDNKAAVEASLAQAKQADGVSAGRRPLPGPHHHQGRRDRLRRRRLPRPGRPDRRPRRATSWPPSAHPRRTPACRSSSAAASSPTSAKSSSESMGMMIGFVVLAITLGSLLAAGLPLLTALIGVVDRHHGPSTALTGVFDISETAPIAGHDARPRGRHRLRVVHPLPPSPEHGRRVRARARRPHRPSRPPAAPSSSPA